MTPNGQIPPNSHAVAIAAAPGKVQSTTISYVQCQNLKYNVIIVGWLGVIISIVILCSSMLTIHMQTDIELLLRDWLLKGATAKEQQFLVNLLTIFSTAAYGLSLINTCVSLLLLIGVAKDSSSLLYPWLIFHGVVFGVALYVGVFYATAGLFIDLSSFLLCLLVGALILLIFYKIYHEVFTLFRVMEQMQQQAAVCYADAEQAWSAMPYQTFYVPHMPLKQ